MRVSENNKPAFGLTDEALSAMPTVYRSDLFAGQTVLVSGAGSGILVVGVDRLMTGLARCCKPVPPDPIAGFVTRGKGITIHRASCANLARIRPATEKANDKERARGIDQLM